MTPYEVVREHYTFPFELRQYQIDEVNYLCEFDRAGYYWQPGTGKTSGSTHHALYWKMAAGYDQWVFILPPVLLLQWERWLKQVRRVSDDAHPSITVYEGAPKKRAAMSLDSEFVLVSMGVFKNDFDRFEEHFAHRRVGVAVDEATSVKNTESDNHNYVKAFADGRPLLLLTGTPLAKPSDAYAYIRLLTGSKVYRNKRHFQKLHVDEVDAYGNEKSWTNLDLLADNMKIQTSRVIRRSVRTELPPVTYVPIPYELAPAHMKLYRRLAEERLVELENGGEIDAISAQRLRAALQQIVCNWAHFEGDPTKRPAIMDVIDNTMEEIGPDKKLVIVANFQMTNRHLLTDLSRYGSVALYGETTPRARKLALERFVDDPQTRIIQLQPQSGGMGIDGLQHVCSDMLAIETPSLALHFHQTVARLDRDGQEDPVVVRLAVAQGTVQVGLFRDLLNNDAMVNSVQGGYQDLRDSTYGG